MVDYYEFAHQKLLQDGLLRPAEPDPTWPARVLRSENDPEQDLNPGRESGEAGEAKSGIPGRTDLPQ